MTKYYSFLPQYWDWQLLWIYPIVHLKTLEKELVHVCLVVLQVIVSKLMCISVPWPFQSNGHCQDTCKFQYAYAILQGNNCWCSNFAPFTQVDVGQCNVDCPGFPSEKCGNQALGLYGYYQLTIQPSGTIGGPASSSTPVRLRSALFFFTTSPSIPVHIIVPRAMTHFFSPAVFIFRLKVK